MWTATGWQNAQSDPVTPIREVYDDDPVRVGADTDVVDVAVLMSDYNLITIPVVDEDRKMIGIITVDDVLEVTLPDDWRRREAARPPGAQPPAGASLARPSAVLDTVHEGDIEGALGRIRIGDEKPGGLRRQLITFLAIVGPGLIVMVGDNDAGGVATYAQAGQNYGCSLLWVLLLLIPVLIVNQEMVVRLGAVTGVGHARLINERFGRFWGWFSVGDLFLLNFLTIVTEFIGVSLALSYFGVSSYISVPVAAAILIGIAMSGSFRRWERSMLAFIAVSLVLLPLLILSHPHWGQIGYHFVVPSVQGGVNSTAVLLVIAMVGTTVAPWQLFFQQSNVIDKRITPRFIKYERGDTTMGAFVVVVGAAAVTLSTGYAFGDVFGLKHSLRRGFRDAKAFYGTYAAMIAASAVIVLIPGTPLGLLTEAVQALAGVLLPSASVFLLLLCNDVEVLGPWMNRRWLNVLAGVIIAVLLVLSGTLLKPVQWSTGTKLGGLTLRGYLAVSVLLLIVKAVQLGRG